MFKGFRTDLTPMSMFDPARRVYLPAPSDSVYHKVKDCSSHISGWKNWENYGVFVIQNPLSLSGEALVAMSTLTKSSNFKSVAKLLEDSRFELEEKEELKGVHQIRRKRDTFYGGYHMSRDAVETIARRMQEEYSNRLSVDENSRVGRDSYLVMATTFGLESRKQVASFWSREFPINWNE